MTIDMRQILAEALRNRDYDGLFNPDAECGCVLDDLAPCDENPWECVPGYLDEEAAREHDCEIWISPAMKVLK